MSGEPLRFVVVAGETSGDNLAAGLIRAVRARRPDARFAGIAGPRMIAAGCEPWAPSEKLAIMGIVEILKHLPELLRVRRDLEARTTAFAPHAYVGVDAPEFNLGVAARLHERFTTVQYVSPQVWAWRQGRVRSMARTLDLVLCLLPFEKRFYDEARLRAEFVGHPLADRVPLEPDRAAARERLGFAPTDTVVALLPGSRRGEVERLGADFLGAARWLAARRPGVRFVAPMANPGARAIFERLLAAPGVDRGAGGSATLDLVVLDGRAEGALTAADVVLVASGTATLETLLCKRPMVVAYRLASLTAWLLRRAGLMKAPYFAQPNLLAGRRVVPELFQEAVTPERLGAELMAWLDAPERVSAVQAEFRRIHEDLRRGADERAAEALLALVDGEAERAGAPAAGAPPAGEPR
ncbi:MAG: lipid-A-disaccharide synthase [Steroidobacteraceae bacterium]|nr:lipid-A-disaccharide synthase [Steroidobacteraceae bacterium]